jgi:hypothetical protein
VSRTLTVYPSGSLKRWLRAVVPVTPAIVLTSRLFCDLVEETGGDPERAGRFLASLVERHERPILVNIAHEDRTIAITPRTWTYEYSLGRLAGLREQLEAAFGEIASIRRLDGTGTGERA